MRFNRIVLKNLTYKFNTRHFFDEYVYFSLISEGKWCLRKKKKIYIQRTKSQIDRHQKHENHKFRMFFFFNYVHVLIFAFIQHELSKLLLFLSSEDIWIPIHQHHLINSKFSRDSPPINSTHFFLISHSSTSH